MPEGREVWITGIGIVSCLGESLEAHWQRLDEPSQRRHDLVSRLTSCTASSRSISTSRSRKRATSARWSAWQRIGTYAAGLALDSAGVKGNAELLSRMDMIVAAGGGERDGKVDISILGGHAQGAESREAFSTSG